MKNIILLLFLSCLSVFGQSQPPFVPGRGGGAGGYLTTNGIAMFPEGVIFFEDFSNAEGYNSTQWLQRRSPSGHSYWMHGNPLSTTTNGFRIINGWWEQTNEVTGALYLGTTNNGAQPWTRIGGMFKFQLNYGPTAPFYSMAAMLNHQFGNFAGSGLDYLHCGIDISGYGVLQRGVAGYGSFEDIAVDTGVDGSIYLRDSVVWDVYYYTNCVITTINGYMIAGTATNIVQAAINRCPIWEINGTYTNSIHMKWKYLWAGFAPPAMDLLARYSGRVNTNGVFAKNVTVATLIGVGTGSYTNRAYDTVVGIPNGANRTNKLITIGTKNVGFEVTVYDAGKTGSGTNIWILPTTGETINGGAPLTNINTDGGSMTLLATPGGWYVKSKF